MGCQKRCSTTCKLEAMYNVWGELESKYREEYEASRFKTWHRDKM